MKCHSPIMVSVAVYAMRYATGPELPRGLSFGVGVGAVERVREKMCVGNMAFVRVRGWQI